MEPVKSLVAETATRNQRIPFTLRVGEGERLEIKAESPHLSMAEKAHDAIFLGGGGQFRLRTGHPSL